MVTKNKTYSIEELNRTIQYWRLTATLCPPKQIPTKKELDKISLFKQLMDKHGY